MYIILFVLFFLPNIFSENNELERIEKQTALYKAKKISEKIVGGKNQWKNPFRLSSPKKINDLASTWLKISPCYIYQEKLYKQMGIEGFYLERENISLKDNRIFISDLYISTQELKNDFYLALKGYKTYPGIYHMIEIAQEDWAYLPKEEKEKPAPINTKQINELRKKGYISSEICPYFKYWAATSEILGTDKKIRRWIYPYYSQIKNPALNFFDPSFAINQIASGKILELLIKGNTILKIDVETEKKTCYLLDVHTTDTLAMMIRKLGGYSFKELDLSFEKIGAFVKSGVDVVLSPVFNTGLIHALFSQDTSFLKLIYRQMLKNNLQSYQFIHKSPDTVNTDLTYFFQEDKLYQNRNLKNEIIASLSKHSLKIKQTQNTLISSPLGYCRETREDKAHFLMSFYLGMQPGIFFLSYLDLRGIIENKAHYPSVKEQIEDPLSYLNHLKKIIKMRKVYHIDTATLIKIPATKHPSLFLLVHKLPLSEDIQISVMNFGKDKIKETLKIDEIEKSYAFDLLERKTFPKSYKSKKLILELDPLSYKCLVFYKKAYNNT